MGWLEFISAIVQSVAWPVCVIVCVLTFRKEILELIPAIRHFNFWGAEVTIERAERKLEKATPAQLEEAFSAELFEKPQSTPERPYVRPENRGHLKELVKGLNGEERVTVLLHNMEGLTFREVAATLDVSEGKARNIHSRAMQKIQEGLVKPPKQ